MRARFREGATITDVTRAQRMLDQRERSIRAFSHVAGHDAANSDPVEGSLET